MEVKDCKALLKGLPGVPRKFAGVYALNRKAIPVYIYIYIPSFPLYSLCCMGVGGMKGLGTSGLGCGVRAAMFWGGLGSRSK